MDFFVGIVFLDIFLCIFLEETFFFIILGNVNLDIEEGEVDWSSIFGGFKELIILVFFVYCGCCLIILDIFFKVDICKRLFNGLCL